MLLCAGLDSTTAMHVVEILRQLALGGRAVITTIHQPSSRLYQTLDKLLLLSKARGHHILPGIVASLLCLSPLRSPAVKRPRQCGRAVTVTLALRQCMRAHR